MALACLETMRHGLQFNICNLESSYLRNKDVPGLDIKDAIPSPLSYSCQFWTDHLTQITANDKLLNQVNDFMQTRFLYWLEVLTLIKELQIAFPALLAVADWSQVSLTYMMSSLN